jgi:hypothetical protein
MTDQENINKMFYNFIVKVTLCLSTISSSICISCRQYHSCWRNVQVDPESESEQREAQVNLTEVIEDPNQSLEEPKANFAQEGKPWSITPIFKLMQLFTYIWYCALSLQELIETLVA